MLVSTMGGRTQVWPAIATACTSHCKEAECVNGGKIINMGYLAITNFKQVKTQKLEQKIQQTKYVSTRMLQEVSTALKHFATVSVRSVATSIVNSGVAMLTC